MTANLPRALVRVATKLQVLLPQSLAFQNSGGTIIAALS